MLDELCMRRSKLAFVLGLAVAIFSLPVSASAQDFDIDGELSGILEGMREPGPTFQINLRGWFVGTPGPMLDMLYDFYEPPGRGFANNGFGVEFLIRDQVKSKRELVFSLDYVDLSGEDGWWKQRGSRLRDVHWVENDFRLLSAEFMFRFLVPLTPDQRLQFYYGAGLGVSGVIGGITQYKVVRTCTEAEGATAAIFERGGDCWPLGGDPLMRPETKESMLFPVLPFLNLGVGFRYLIADMVSIGVDAGFRTFYVYAGASLGFAWQTWIYR